MLKTYIEISLGVSIAILMIFALTPLFNRRYTAKWRYILWIITASLLIIPLKFDFAPRVNVNMPVQNEFINRPIAVTAVMQEENAETAVKTWYGAAQNGVNTSANIEDSRKAITVKQIITAVWILGIIAFMLYYILGYALFCRKIRPWCREEESGVKSPRIMTCKIIKSPMLIGFLKPRILLPPNIESDIDLILRHEMTHYRRGDLWIKLLFIIANAVHWFNPIIYLMRYAANKDVEYSCDETVVKNRDMEFKKAYSKAILHSASGGSGTALSTYFKEDKKNLKKRFSNILSGRKKKGVIIGCIICAAVILCAGVFAFSDNKDDRADKGRIIGNYEKDAVGSTHFYLPDAYTQNAEFFSEAFIDALDTAVLDCEVISIEIDGREQLNKSSECGVWYNERMERFHTCITANTKDKHEIIVQPYGQIQKTENGYYGEFRYVVYDMERHGEAAEGERLSDEVIHSAVTGVGTNEIRITSDDGKYNVKIKVIS